MNSKFEIFEKALNRLPNIFTGTQFSKECRVLGYDTKNDSSKTEFLHRNCVQDEFSNRTWIKRSTANKVELNEKECIEFLKSIGYKIFKAEYKEV